MEFIFVDDCTGSVQKIIRGTNTVPTEEELKEELFSFQKNALEENKWDNPPFDLEQPIYVHCECPERYPFIYKITIFQKGNVKEYLKNKDKL